MANGLKKSTRRVPRGVMVVVALLGAIAAPIESLAGVNITQGKWRDGSIVWYYNNALRPASLTDSDFIALTTRAFDLWGAGCNLTVRYGGTTSVGASNAEAIAAGKLVVGFATLAANVGGSAAPLGADTAGGAGDFTAGVVQINADNTPYNLASDRLLYILVHEIGHVLNLAHSDEPYSVMYANPYSAVSSASEPYKLYADDISTCANLYGSRGLQSATDHTRDTFVPTSNFGLSLGVGEIVSNGGATIAVGSAQDTWVNVSANAVDLSRVDNFPWLRVLWDHPVTTQARVSLIAPSGDIVLDNYSVFTGPDTVLNGYFPFRNGMYLNGTWTARAYVNGSPAAQTTFTTINGVSSPAKLEVAAIAESVGSGDMAFRIANYSQVGIASSSVFLNGNTSTPVQTFQTGAGSHVLDLWAESNLPRYRAGSACGQPGASSDLTRQIRFTSDAAGKVTGNSIEVAESGTLIGYSARANIQASANTTQNVYVAAQFNETILFRQSDGTWGTTAAPLFSFAGPGVANFDILRDFDTRSLPTGSMLVVGYGATLHEVIGLGQFKSVRVF